MEEPRRSRRLRSARMKEPDDTVEIPEGKPKRQKKGPKKAGGEKKGVKRKTATKKGSSKKSRVTEGSVEEETMKVEEPGTSGEVPVQVVVSEESTEEEIEVPFAVDSLQGGPEPSEETTESFDRRPSMAEEPKEELEESGESREDAVSSTPLRGKESVQGSEKEEEHKPERVSTMCQPPSSDILSRRRAFPRKIGAHVSVAGGVHFAVKNAFELNSTAFAFFLKSPRSYKCPPPYSEGVIEQFSNSCSEFGFSPSHILPHGNYLVNLGGPDPVIRTKSKECFVDDMKRARSLGLSMLNIHPGSDCGAIDRLQSIRYVAGAVNDAMKVVPGVMIVLENTAGGGGTLGKTFEELKMLISLMRDKSRVGVCLDTAHLWAAGYDLKTPSACEKTFALFDSVVGASFLKGMHLNDSKSPRGSNVDRHENIGKGMIGRPCFQWIVRNERFNNIPLIVETLGPFDKEINQLYKLAGVQ